MYGVVKALIHRRLHPAIPLADAHDLGDLPRHVVRDAELLELALLMELVHSTQRVLVRCLAVRAVQVPHVDGAGGGEDSVKRW